MHQVLVLNQDYAPLQVAAVRRAFVLVYRGKAEVLELSDVPIRTPVAEYPRPSVIRLTSYVKRPRPRPKLTRRTIFARDQGECLYCGKRVRELTLDHVVPRHRGGRDTWDNLASACRPCNHRKGGRTPQEARMQLRQIPYEPAIDARLQWLDHPDLQRDWTLYLGLEA
jgi:5-methylcytosine-specific restriction endonuclease McrA